MSICPTWCSWIFRLPDLDGDEAARQLGADERTASIPVVALSALPIGEAEPWFRDAGFAGYVEKPIDVLEAAPSRFVATARRGSPSTIGMLAP